MEAYEEKTEFVALKEHMKEELLLKVKHPLSHVLKFDKRSDDL